MKDAVVEWANGWGRKMGIYGVSTDKIPAGQHDDLDAFRHAFCHAYVMGWLSFTPRNKDVSDWIGLIMEMPGLFSAQSTTPCASAMDYHNNQVGQDLAPTREEMLSVLRYLDDPTPFIAKRIADAVKRGDTINSFDDPRMPKHCHAQAKLPNGDYGKKDERELEMLMLEREGDAWWFRRHPAIRIPANRAMVPTALGFSVLNPAIALLFKSNRLDDKDHLDFEHALPVMDTADRVWLKQALAMVDAGHVWGKKL